MGFFLQIELDAKKKVAPAARLAGIDEAQFGWGLVCLWEWCLTEKADQTQTDQLEAFFGADQARLIRALVAFGFAEVLEDGAVRVRGVDRYIRVSEAKRAGGRARAASARRDENGRLSGPTKRQQAASRPPASAGEPTSSDSSRNQLLNRESIVDIRDPKERDPLSRAREGSPPPKANPPPDSAGDRPKQIPPLPEDVASEQPGALRDRIEQVFGMHRGGVLYEWTHADERSLARVVQHGVPEIVRRWDIALRRKRYPTCDSVEALVKNWNSYAADEGQVAPATAPKKRSANGF